MAFEAFRAESQPRPRRGRVTVVLSIAFHGALLAVGVAYSFWHVDELTPPSVKVTFLSAAPPPPPPPPPAGGGGAARKKAVIKPKTPTKPTDIVQPRETPEEKPKESRPDPSDGPGERGGVKGGVIGGTIGGTVGGTIGGQIGGTKGGVIGGTVGGTGAAKPKFVPPDFARQNKLSGDDPKLPAYLAARGGVYREQLKMCVGTSGGVETVNVLQGVDPTLDKTVSEKVRTWRFRPFATGNSTPVPYCFVWTLEFRIE